ncbi:MAG: family efflux transporter permease subunit [Phenylobacterium sp.]|uniref:DHA2 family efflux MFS transporter permease subunit n=1 Tax=Phenylobacterium sp. TaxID=1871053 RepID=UPI00260261A4|nr:DHA2 family efflux MFS transporter permease subunit [Phenylobacterium sp.]MDB5498515.1 family efflux transporter permease subunit [Phenylobacterium sp.]
MTAAAAKTPGPALSAGFAMMCLGMFMAILDVQVVATSIPTIEHALKVSGDRISWIQTAYLIAEVIAIPLTGVLTRILSMRWLFVAALSVFTLSSAGCAASSDFATLIAWRVVQGLSGGTLIPAVFSAVFLLFPERRQALATTVAGVLAVLAPTVGPIVGGWITQTYSWHWLFLINLAPGIVAASSAAWLLPREAPRWAEARTLDLVSLALMALALAALEIALKEAPHRGWLSPPILGLAAVTVSAGTAFVLRTLKAAHPLVELHAFARRSFAVGCVLSFVLGAGLFGSVYLMPVFLGAVRGYGALDTGKVMLVTGVAQLATAPIAVALERRIGARALSAFGFALFALGLGMSSFETTQTGFAQMFWPQVVRGVAIMFCLLPPTRMALGHLADEAVADASGLFNLMRNLGGAIGLALIDTVLYGRGPHHAQAIVARLQAGDTATARAVGIPLELFALRGSGPLDPGTRAMLQPMIERLAFARAANEAWAMAAALTAAALGSLLLAPGQPRLNSGPR